MIDRAIHREMRWSWVEMQCGVPNPFVEPHILEENIGGVEKAAGADPAPWALFAANLEQIRKIVVEKQAQVETGVALSVVLKADSLICSTAPQEDRAHDVQHVLSQHDFSVAEDIRIGEVDRQ